MRTKPGISVLIATRNRAELLDCCLHGLSVQTTAPNEVVVVDNGSTDATPSVISSYRDALPLRIIGTRAEGFPAVYNAGIAACGRVTIVFLDDDCSVGRTWMHRLASSIRRHPHAVIQGRIIGTPKGNLYAEIMSDHYQNWLKSHLSSGGLMDTCDNKNLAVPKEFFYPNGTFSGFDERMKAGSEDIEFGLRMRKRNIRIVYDPSFPAFHRERTTFMGFVTQHMRIARSESVLHAATGYEKTALFPAAKTTLNMRSFVRRELAYLKKGLPVTAVFTAVLYGILFGVRVYGYLIHEKNRHYHVTGRTPVSGASAATMV